MGESDVDGGTGVFLADDGEFAFRFPRLSVDFLRRKARSQMRDAFGRWVDERASTVSDVHAPLTPLTPLSRGLLTSRTPKSIEIQKDDIFKELTDAGWKNSAAASLAERGRLFKYSDNGSNAIYVYFVDERHATQSRVEKLKNTEKEKYEKLMMIENQYMTKYKKGSFMGESKGLAKIKAAAQIARSDYIKALHRLEEETDRWHRLHGHNSETTSDEYITQLADDAGELLSISIQKMPSWKRNSARAFMVEFDESALFSAGTGLVPAQGVRGGNTITMHREYFYNSTDLMPPKQTMSIGATTFGEYTIPHEAGHLVDEADTSSQRSSMTNTDVWREAIETGLMSIYGQRNPREGYAEAYAMWQHDPTHPIAMLYDKRFGWSTSDLSVINEQSNSTDLTVTNTAPRKNMFTVAMPAGRPMTQSTGRKAMTLFLNAGFPPETAEEVASGGTSFTRDGIAWVWDPDAADPMAVRNARRALLSLEEGIARISGTAATDQPFLVEISKELADAPDLLGATSSGSSRIALSRALFDQDSVIVGDLRSLEPNEDPVRFGVHHSLGHAIDQPRNSPGSSTGTAGSDAYRLARDLPGMTERGRKGPEEAFAEAFRKWLSSDQSKATDFYSYVFQWGSINSGKMNDATIKQRIEEWSSRNVI